MQKPEPALGYPSSFWGHSQCVGAVGTRSQGSWCISPGFPMGLPGDLGRVSSAYLPSPQFWQLYNAVTLFELSSHEECREWQVQCVRSSDGGPGEKSWRTHPLSALVRLCSWGLGGGEREFRRPGSPSVA